MFVFLTLCLSALVALSESTCVDPAGIESFQVKDILGTWWEWKRYESNEQTGDCVKGVYTAGSDDKTFNIEVTRVDASGTAAVYDGTVTSTAASGWNGTLDVILYNQMRHYTVVNFEPKSHLVLYNCESGRDEMWFLVRNRYPTAEEAAEFDAILASLGLNESTYVDNQDEAFCGSN